MTDSIQQKQQEFMDQLLAQLKTDYQKFKKKHDSQVPESRIRDCKCVETAKIMSRYICEKQRIGMAINLLPRLAETPSLFDIVIFSELLENACRQLLEFLNENKDHLDNFCSGPAGMKFFLTIQKPYLADEEKTLCFESLAAPRPYNDYLKQQFPFDDWDMEENNS
jgi:hypothetical protein